MAHLAAVYAKDLGVKVGFPYFQEHWFPTPDHPYIVLHNGEKVPAKNYSYFGEVVRILKPELETRGIKIYQIGAPNEPTVEGVDKFIKTNSLKQSAFLIKHSLMLVGIDSCPVHIASHFDKPTVSIYSHTWPSTCQPIWNPGKATVIESDRNGAKPTFSRHEDPKTIDCIKPEEIVEAVFDHLEIEPKVKHTTLFTGTAYLHKTIDVIPSEPPSHFETREGEKLRVRMDLHFSEEVLISCLQSFENVEIILDRPINPAIINSFKPKISKIVLYSKKFDKDFLECLRTSALSFELCCTSKKTLKNERNKFFNFEIIYENPIEEAKEKQKKLMKKFKSASTRFYSGKSYLCGDKITPYLGTGIEDTNFWLDIEFFKAYSEE